MHVPECTIVKEDDATVSGRRADAKERHKQNVFGSKCIMPRTKEQDKQEEAASS